MTGLEDLGNSSTLPFRSTHPVVPGRLVGHPGQQQSWLGGDTRRRVGIQKP